MNEISNDCGALRERLAHFAVDACEADERAAIETHVASCAACARELAALRGASAALAHWNEPLDEADPRELARAAIAAARTRARRRRRIALAAAAVIAFATLFALGGARMRLADGGLELALGRARLAEPRETERALAELEARHAEALGALRSEWAQERTAWIDAFDRARAADRELVAAELQRVAQGAAVDTAETRGALLDLVAYVAKRDAP